MQTQHSTYLAYPSSVFGTNLSTISELQRAPDSRVTFTGTFDKCESLYALRFGLVTLMEGLPLTLYLWADEACTQLVSSKTISFRLRPYGKDRGSDINDIYDRFNYPEFWSADLDKNWLTYPGYCSQLSIEPNTFETSGESTQPAPMVGLDYQLVEGYIRWIPSTTFPQPVWMLFHRAFMFRKADLSRASRWALELPSVILTHISNLEQFCTYQYNSFRGLTHLVSTNPQDAYGMWEGLGLVDFPSFISSACKSVDYAWFNNNLIVFPNTVRLLNTTSVRSAWRNNNLTSFDMSILDQTKLERVDEAWANNQLTSFVASGEWTVCTNFTGAWANNPLVDFYPGTFVLGFSVYTSSLGTERRESPPKFDLAWANCNLNAASVERILVALNAAKYRTITTTIGYDGAALTSVAQQALAALRLRGCDITLHTTPIPVEEFSSSYGDSYLSFTKYFDVMDSLPALLNTTLCSYPKPYTVSGYKDYYHTITQQTPPNPAEYALPSLSPDAFSGEANEITTIFTKQFDPGTDIVAALEGLEITALASGIVSLVKITDANGEGVCAYRQQAMAGHQGLYDGGYPMIANTNYVLSNMSLGESSYNKSPVIFTVIGYESADANVGDLDNIVNFVCYSSKILFWRRFNHSMNWVSALDNLPITPIETGTANIVVVYAFSPFWQTVEGVGAEAHSVTLEDDSAEFLLRLRSINDDKVGLSSHVSVVGAYRTSLYVTADTPTTLPPKPLSAYTLGKTLDISRPGVRPIDRSFSYSYTQTDCHLVTNRDGSPMTDEWGDPVYLYPMSCFTFTNLYLLDGQSAAYMFLHPYLFNSGIDK